MEKSDEFLKRLQSTFRLEAKEHITAMSSGLVSLENASGPGESMEILEAVFREAHSLKGAARTVNLTRIETVCQSLESVFAALKRNEISFYRELFDILHEAVDTLDTFLQSAETGATASDESAARDIIERLELVSKGEKPPTGTDESKIAHHGAPGPSEYRPAAEAKPATADTIRISSAKLDSILLQAEELLSTKLFAGQRAADLREINSELASLEKRWSKVYSDVRTARRAIDSNGNHEGLAKKREHLLRAFEYLEWHNSFLRSLSGKLAALEKAAEHDRRSLGAMVDSLREDMKKALMLPFSSLLEIFPKIVRDLAHDQGKNAEIMICGADIEIDRRILQEMRDPLVHLTRNCLDHGIEKPDERECAGKHPFGTIRLDVSQADGKKVEIVISDDGKGVDLVKVKASAVGLGVLSRQDAEKLDDRKALALVFQSGITTSPIITDISGRGIGLAIVGEKVERLGGRISVESHSGFGTTVRIILPITLAVFRGVLVRSGLSLFVLPMTNVDRVARVSKEEIKTVENRETVRLDGQAFSLVRLGDVLELPRKNAAGDPSDKAHMVVLGSAEKRIAFQVDEIISEQEVLVKDLGKQLSRVRNIAGATILGMGKVVPILNAVDLMKSAVNVSARPAMSAVTKVEAGTKRKSVLVVEDSITSRTLLKNILETAGFSVKTAFDGIDALTTLKTEVFDVVVSDVDMPRMNGFDLTARIRADRNLTHLPVVLVTALGSHEDRERGVDAGANAYIVKTSFDQSNLLGVLERLI